MKPKPPVQIAVNSAEVKSFDEALAHLRASVRQSPALKLRLKRLGLLFAGGRALKLIGGAWETKAFEQAIKGYASSSARQREVFELKDLPRLPAGGLHLTWCRADGWPLCEYHLELVPAEELTLKVTGQDGHGRLLSAKAFQGLFSSSTNPLHASRGWRAVSLHQPDGASAQPGKPKAA